ncbi:MAG TPA: class I SAM-dependent methyltransferase [Ferruginibacter sp.]|nr:class I SAM-dependent methyltransferase [Ferruginibacter sp.]
MHLIQKEQSVGNWFNSDEQFNRLYPLSIKLLAARHWTPIIAAKKAAAFLAVGSGVRVLDIGSGVGKFCLAAAHHYPKAFYYGIEQRENLILHAERARQTLEFNNVSFIHGNFTQLDFRNYDSFYFYNSFYENLVGNDKIDDSIDYSGELFDYYNRYLYTQLLQKPAGTRLTTFHSMENEVPDCYHIVGTEMDNRLKHWLKL